VCQYFFMADGNAIEDMSRPAVPLTPELIELGRDVTFSMLNWTIWVHRKVESLDLLPGAGGRRRVSVDCTPPKIAWRGFDAPEADGSDGSLVPLTLMGKGPLLTLDVTDSGGASVPVLGRAANSVLAASAMAFILWAEKGGDIEKIEVTAVLDQWDTIWEIASGPAPVAAAKAEELIRDQALEALPSKFFRDFSASFLLTVLLRSDQPQGRQILKYSYHWQIETNRKLWLITRAGFGLTSLEIEVQLGSLYSARSYHLELRAPNGINFTGLSMPKDETRQRPTSSSRGQVVHAIGHYSYVEQGDAEMDGALLRFDLDSSRLLPRVFWSGLGVGILFWLLRFLPGTFNALAHSTDAAIALLLFVPALIVGLNAREPENALVGRLQLPLRVYSICIALFLFISGSMLVLESSRYSVQLFWLIFAVATTFGTVLSAVGIIRLKIRGRV
jgi:hypothetical protein